MGKALTEKLVNYTINVENWSYFYSYIAEPLTHLEVNEFVHLETLELHGRVTRPKKAEVSAIIRIACEKASRDGEQIRYDRPVLGNIYVKTELLEAYVLLPPAHVTRLTSIIASDRTKVVRMTATNLVARKALIRSINISTDFDG
jgi:hypothetical protein